MPPKAEKKNNGFDRLRADLKAQTPQNVYLFYGEETYLRSYYLEELHRLLIPAGFEEFNYHRLSGKGLTVQELAAVTVLVLTVEHLTGKQAIELVPQPGEAPANEKL